MAELIASGLMDVNSADFTLTDGQTATLSLKDPVGPVVLEGSRAMVQIKSAENEYFTVGLLTYKDPCQVLAASGVFRVRRENAVAAFGVDKS